MIDRVRTFNLQGDELREASRCFAMHFEDYKFLLDPEEAVLSKTFSNLRERVATASRENQSLLVTEDEAKLLLTFIDYCEALRQANNLNVTIKP